MKLFKDRVCPCCSNLIPFQDYNNYRAKNNNEGKEPVYFKCSSCNKIILSFTEDKKYPDRFNLFLIFFFSITFYFFHTLETRTYIIYGLLLIIWLIINMRLSYMLAEFRCFTYSEVYKIDNEYFTDRYMVFFTLLLLIGLGAILFYTFSSIKPI